MNLLLLDVETAPNLCHVWGLWQQNVGLPQIIDSGYVLCWSAKWLGTNEVYHMNLHDYTAKKMLKGIHTLLDKADAVIHYNGTKFDIPTLNKEFLLYNLAPPKPYKQIDLLKTARSQFRFPSNKLDYVSQALGLPGKTKHRGHQLWIDCMNGDEKAWEEMKEYNINDVFILEEVYKKLLPWIKNHPNQNLYSDEEHVCPNCGGKHLQKRGFAYVITGMYRQYQCQTCGSWSRGTKRARPAAAIRNGV